MTAAHDGYLTGLRSPLYHADEITRHQRCFKHCIRLVDLHKSPVSSAGKGYASIIRVHQFQQGLRMFKLRKS